MKSHFHVHLSNQHLKQYFSFDICDIHTYIFSSGNCSQIDLLLSNFLMEGISSVWICWTKFFFHGSLLNDRLEYLTPIFFSIEIPKQWDNFAFACNYKNARKMQEKNSSEMQSAVEGKKLANYFKVIAFSAFYINMEMRQNYYAIHTTLLYNHRSE